MPNRRVNSPPIRQGPYQIPYGCPATRAYTPAAKSSTPAPKNPQPMPRTQARHQRLHPVDQFVELATDRRVAPPVLRRQLLERPRRQHQPLDELQVAVGQLPQGVVTIRVVAHGSAPGIVRAIHEHGTTASIK